MKRFIFILTMLLALSSWAGAMHGAELLDPRIVDIENEFGGTLGRPGGTLTIVGGLEGPRTFNPHLASETSSTQITDRVFDGLVELHRDTGRIMPKLARDFDVRGDGTEIIFYLRRGVKWHDGHEFTADDVVFTFDVIYDKNIGSNSRSGLLVDGKPMKYEKIDTYTVKFTLPRPYAPIMYNIGIPIIPEHVLGQAYHDGRFPEMWGVGSDLSEIIGTGAWRVSSYRQDQELVLISNDNYYEFDVQGNRLPYLNRAIFRYYSDAEDIAEAFFGGEFDYVQISANEYSMYQEREPSASWTIMEAGVNPGTSFIVLNQNTGYVPEPKLSWFTDINFRQALAHAVDKETILEAALNGRGYVQQGPIGRRNAFFMKEDIKTYPYDLQEAHRRLEESGYTLGADGIRRDPSGVPLEFELITSSGMIIWQVTGELLAEDLAALGIRVDFKLLPFHDVVNKLTTSYDWDAIIVGLTGTFDPNGGSNVWLSSGNLHMWHPLQEHPHTHWEATIDELWYAAQRALEPDVRREVYYRFQDVVAEQVPLIYTVVPVDMVAVRDHLRNAIPDGLGGSISSGWNFIWIDR